MKLLFLLPVVLDSYFWLSGCFWFNFFSDQNQILYVHCDRNHSYLYHSLLAAQFFDGSRLMTFSHFDCRTNLNITVQLNIFGIKFLLYFVTNRFIFLIE